MERSVVVLQVVATMAVLLATGCVPSAINKLPGGATSGAPERTVVLFRVAVQMNDKPFDSPYSGHLVRFHINLGDVSHIEPGSSSQSGQGFVPASPSTQDKKAGWAFLSLKPGSYGMALSWLSHNEESGAPVGVKEYLSDTIQISVPGGATLIYIGTFRQYCADNSTLVNVSVTCVGPKVVDEETAAQEVVQRSLSTYAPMTKALASVSPSALSR